ncbi:MULTISPECIES: hypothetical protein [Aequorivita]|uniref:Uncharacterized protein n=1 Tax=Aequorivita iocasae TaxID=2803865 RepID=A0ABX7DUL3_9FLAO|nr:MULTISPECIES: hypothetical protein [Aequorivita]QQX77502.1 hypothetical protein JK629_04305 [Aequorivita iocasae]UCA56995.1 hypothetical protein LDL78_04330 [Aequorivita sp. F7]
MKHVEKHIGRLLVSFAILLVFGNLAFAGETVVKSKTTKISALQHNDHGKPFVFNEIAVGETSQTVSQNEYLGFGLFGTLYSNQDFSFSNVPSLFTSSYSEKDKRELIFRHLFPFHFFW